MKATACITESYAPALKKDTKPGLAATLFSQAGVVVFATGADSCTRSVYDAAAALGADDRFFHCSLSEQDYILGTAEAKIEARLSEILKLPGIRAVVVYTSCMDILTGTDLSSLIERIENENHIPVKLLLRGPLAQRAHKPKETLKKIIEDLPAPVGDNYPREKRLPPLYPDINSVSAILQEWDFHNYLVTAGGCSGCICSLPDHPQYRLRKSRLDDIQIALGCDELLENGIASDANAAGKPKTALIGSAVLTLSGFDYSGLACGLKKRDVDCLYLPANGFDPGPAGAANAFLLLGRSLIEVNPKQADRVNILGYDPMVFISKKKIAHGIEHLNRRSLHAYYFGSGDLGDVRSSSGAALNWVVSAEGLPLAQYMEQRFGVPMITGVPVGRYAMTRWRKRINEMTDRDDEQLVLPASAPPCDSQPKIIIIGEPMLTGSLAFCLDHDLGLTETRRFVYDPRQKLRAFYEKDFSSILYFSDESELRQIIHSADVWIADPIYKEIVDDSSALFIPIPDPLISGMRFADMPYELFGKKGGAYLETALQDLL